MSERSAMNTGSRDEQKMLADIDAIAHNLHRIANVMEAHEMRAREAADAIGGWCDTDGCHTTAIVQVNGLKYCRTHVVAGMEKAIQAVHRGFDDMEAQRDAPE
jgi:hypothetical protein